MNFDTLEYNGAERTFKAWGINLDSILSVLENATLDKFNFRLALPDVSADPIFPYEAFVIVRTNRASETGADNTFSEGTIEFQGKRVVNRLNAEGKSQRVDFEFQGPWYDLTITQYLQEFKGLTAGYKFAEVILNTAAAPLISTSGVRFISMGDQLQCILQFVLDAYAAQGLPAPFQYVGRNLNAGAIDLDVGAGPPTAQNENTDASGAPYLYAVNTGTTIDLDLFKHFLKSEIVRPMAASETIQKLLDSSPRTIVAFDYATTPPTIHIRNVDNLPAATLPFFDGVPGIGGNKALELQRRDDLVPSVVIIVYRITSSSGGSQVIDYAVDKWGPHGSNSPLDPDFGPGVISQILDLQGFNQTFSQAVMDSEPLACIGGTHAQRRAWWASDRGGQLADLKTYRVRFQTPDPADEEVVNPTTIPDAKFYYESNGFDSTGAAVAADQEFTAADYAFFGYRMVGGTQHSWMKVGATGVKSVKVKVQAAMQYAEYDCLGSGPTPELDETGNLIRQHNEALQHCNITLTNGTTGPYSTEASFTEGESYIIGNGGIAQYLFTMLSVLQYDGEHVKVKTAFEGGVSLLNRANFSGGRAEWETIKAQIQEIKKNWSSKETTVRIGVSKHLSAAQLSAFLNMWRYRRTWFNPAVKGDNTIASNGAVEMPKAVGGANTLEGLKTSQQQKHLVWETPPSGSTPGVVAAQINNDPNKIPAILTATTPTPATGFTSGDLTVMQPRKVQVCLPDGTAASMIVHSTAPFTEP